MTVPLMLDVKMYYVFQKPEVVQKRYCEKFVKAATYSFIKQGF